MKDLLGNIAGTSKSSTYPREKDSFFTDGCGVQYKNTYNFSNLCHHVDNFQLEAELR